MTSFNLAMGQMRVDGGEPEKNLDRAVDLIHQAAKRDCRVIVLPECLDLGWTHPSARDLAEPIPGPLSGRLAAAAREAGIYVAAGLTERSGDLIYNAAILLSPEGELLLKHRKINELDIAHDLYANGDCLGVARTPLGTIGLNICADNFTGSQALAHSLGRMGAQLLLSPCAWAVPADYDNDAQPYGRMWHDSYTTLSQLYDMTIVGVSNVGPMTGGPWDGRICIGCSLAVAPGGKLLIKGPYGETAETLLVIPVEIGPASAHGTTLLGRLRKKGYHGP